MEASGIAEEPCLSLPEAVSAQTRLELAWRASDEQVEM